MLPIVGIHGKAVSGKDTVADQLVREFAAAKESFAAPLYKGLAVMLDIPVADLQRRATKEEPIEWLDRSPRFLLQTLGTEWGRDLVGWDVWVRALHRRCEQVEAVWEDNGYLPRAWVISDVRFEDEAAFVREHGVLIHLVRDGAPPVNGHVSELGVEFRADVDLVLENNGTLDDLAAAVRAFAQTELGWPAPQLIGSEVTTV